MKKFNFRLQKILDYRSSLQEEKRTALQQALLSLREAEDKLSWFEDEYLKNIASEDAVIQVEELVMQARYAERLQEEIVAQRVVIAERLELVESARQEYIAASKEKEILSRFKDRKSEEYLHATMALEAKQIDEMTTQRYKRI